MKSKKILLSAKKEHDVIKNVIKKLKEVKNIKLILHDPTKDFFDMENMSKIFGDIDLFIVKVGSECSIDLLHFAKIHNIPTLHDVDTVLICKNKVALDYTLRKIFNKWTKELQKFYLPKSWTHSLLDVVKFKKWATPYLPIVIKSHYQHNKNMRFNFLVKDIEEVDDFCKKYSNFLSYDVYIQKFIESDGIERKIYVVGDKIFGIKRENPIYIFLRNKPDSIDVNTIKREKYEVSKEMKYLANILSKELNLKIFGFDLIKSIDQDRYYLIDLNDFPGFKGINNIDNILADFIKDYINI
ncbi:MAG: RimK family alpha-L-glutamate ligase [Promethearchaeota archaeon]